MDEKKFLVYINKVPSFYLPLPKHIKIEEIKNYFLKNYPNYSIRFFVNSSYEIKVFLTNKYNSTNLESIWDKIDNGFILLKKSFHLPKDIEEKTITTYRNETSYNGYNTSDLKSWLQKSIRRNKPDDAIWAAVELYTIPKQGIVTNLFNRLRIIAMEDIGIANPLIVPIVDEILESLQTSNKPKLPVKEEGVKKVAELASYMARSKHLRAASDYKAIFMTPYIRNTLIKMYPNIYQKHIPYIEEKNEDPKILGQKMIDLLREKNDSAFYMMAKILNLKKLSFKTYGSSHPAYYVLSLIKVLSDELNLKFSVHVDILVKWLKGGIINSKVDYNLPIYHAMLMILKRDEMKMPEINMEEVEIKNFLPNREVLKIPEYALDKHTLTGKRKGKTSIDFAVEGAFVENEDKELLNPNYREVYLESKNIKPDTIVKTNLVKDEIPLESDVFDFDVRVQATVADHRTDTYLATEKATGRFVFVKGPYKTEEDVKIPITVYNIKKLIAPELPAIQVEKIMLKPDFFPDLPWGLRRHLDRTKGYWFLVSESLLKQPVPRKMHNTPKWGDVEVIDYSKVDEPKKPEPLKLKGKALQLYVLNMLFRYALGIPDEADRNFMLMNDGRVFAVDEEGMNSNTNFKNALREKKSGMILKYVKENWDEIEPIMNKWMERSKDLGIEWHWINKRLKDLQTIYGIKKIFG